MAQLSEDSYACTLGLSCCTNVRNYLPLLRLITPVLSVITSSANGFDGSLMNNFQSLYQWEDYFHTPSGSLLGALSAMQVNYSMLLQKGEPVLRAAPSEYRLARRVPLRAVPV